MNVATRFPGFTLVTKDQFANWLKVTKVNAHPSLENHGPYDREKGYLHTWQDLNNCRAVLGYSNNADFYLRNDIAVRFS